ncbi:heterokaryon incompatibility protein [Paraphaeosphaeria sporulosa]
MSHLYSNSYLNIAASDSLHGDTGLCFDDRPDVPNVWKVTFPPTGTALSAAMPWEDQSKINKLYVWNCITKRTRALIEESPLAKRAWTLQKRLLPPRTLYLRREQIARECRVSTAYEALPEIFEEGTIGLSPENFARVLQDDDPLEDIDNVKLWSNIVEDYSKRSLTHGRDKLVAISGLAEMLASVYGMEYVAGLWVKDLIRLLLWHKRHLEPSIPSNKSAAYRAPSWSWASADREVKIPQGFLAPLGGRKRNWS